MRIFLIAALAALLSTASPAAAAPTSMMQNLPESQADPGRGAGGMNWLTKWFRQGQPAPAPAQPTSPPIAAYQAPPAAPTASTPALAPHTMPVVTAPQATPTLPPAASAADCKALRDQGHAHDRAGDLTTAEAIYRQAIGADPNSAAAVNDLGLCLARQGKLELSADTLLQAIAMRPEKPLYRNNLATVLVELGRVDEALENLKTVYGPGAAHFNLGQLLARGGKTDQAAEQMQQALRHEPGFAPAREALASLRPAKLAEAEVIDVPAPPAAQVATPSVPRVAAAATPARAAAPAPSGVPTFPRLLPPVLDR